MKTKRLILIPLKPMWDKFYEITERCADISDRYMLGETSSIPHITLVKFDIDSDSSLDDIWDRLDKKTPNIVFDRFYYDSRDDGYAWVGVYITRNEVIEAQRKYYNLIREMGGIPAIEREIHSNRT